MSSIQDQITAACVKRRDHWDKCTNGGLDPVTRRRERQLHDREHAKVLRLLAKKKRTEAAPKYRTLRVGEKKKLGDETKLRWDGIVPGERVRPNERGCYRRKVR